MTWARAELVFWRSRAAINALKVYCTSFGAGWVREPIGSQPKGGQRGHVPPLGRSGRRCDMSMEMWLLFLHYILLVQELFQNKSAIHFSVGD